MAIESIGAQRNVNPFLSGISGGSGTHTTQAATQMRGEDDSRGSAWNGFDISNWKGAPVYGAGEHKFDYSA